MDIPVKTTKILGIFQPDIIIQSALQAAIADVRANDWLLDYAFSSLAKDDLTSPIYGQKQIDLAKKWFLSTNIPVVMNHNAEGGTYPCISIALGEDAETENTLADVNYDTYDTLSSPWPALYGPFTPVSYDAVTGELVLPADVDIVLAAGQIVVTKGGTQYPILEAPETDAVYIAKGITEELNDSSIKGQQPNRLVEIESANFKQTISIGCHTIDDGKNTQGIWLYCIMKFILLRYRQWLFEARGYERTTIMGGPAQFEIEGDSAEQRLFCRYIQVSGYGRSAWPKNITGRITSVDTFPTFVDP